MRLTWLVRACLRQPETSFTRSSPHTTRRRLRMSPRCSATPPGTFEYQRLHGMGEELYSQVIAPEQGGHACRVYAPVGPHEDLLPYLVRRLLRMARTLRSSIASSTRDTCGSGRHRPCRAGRRLCRDSAPAYSRTAAHLWRRSHQFEGRELRRWCGAARHQGRVRGGVVEAMARDGSDRRAGGPRRDARARESCK